MPYIAKALRQFVVERAKGLCEYCQTQQHIVISMEVDHIQPQSAGGSNLENNLALACTNCNNYKSDAMAGHDLETKQVIALFNPRTQLWREHFRWSEAGIHLVGLTPVGRVTIEKLQINHPDVIRARKIWVSAGWHPPKFD